MRKSNKVIGSVRPVLAFLIILLGSQSAGLAQLPKSPMAGQLAVPGIEVGRKQKNEHEQVLRKYPEHPEAAQEDFQNSKVKLDDVKLNLDAVKINLQNPFGSAN